MILSYWSNYKRGLGCLCCTMMDRDQSFLLHIVVHRGSFHDASHERRVGLWFFPSDQGPQYCTGSVLPLAYTTKTRPICTKKLVQLLQRVPIRNDDNEFNGQQWVWSALECLTRNGYLTKHQQDDGLSQMLEAILNGSSDEVQQAGHRRND